MRKTHILALALALVPPSGSALAQTESAENWRHLFRDEMGEMSIDMASLRRDGDRFTIVNRIVLNQPQGAVASVRLLSRYDCARRTFSMLRVTEYRADGSVLGDHEIPAERVNTGPAGERSPSAAIINVVCPMASAS